MLCLPQGDIVAVRAAYDAFLCEYPLCYGYWKRYAEAERRHGSSSASGSADATNTAPQANGITANGGANGGGGAAGAAAAAAAVYQRGLAVLPHSCELWVAYAALLQAADAPPEAVRG
jgi:pre-mRNA-processing factor 39